MFATIEQRIDAKRTEQTGDSPKTRFAKFVPVVVTAAAIVAIAVALPRPMQASNSLSASPASMQIDEITRAAGPLPQLEIDNYF